MTHTKKDIEDLHTLIETVEKTDKLLAAIRRGKKLQLHWGATIGDGNVMVGCVTLPPSAHQDLEVLATKWRDEAREELDARGIELPQKPPDDIEEMAYVP